MEDILQFDRWFYDYSIQLRPRYYTMADFDAVPWYRHMTLDELSDMGFSEIQLDAFGRWWYLHELYNMGFSEDQIEYFKRETKVHHTRTYRFH